MKWLFPLCFLLALTSTSPSLAIEIRVRGATRLEARMERHPGGLILMGGLATDWGAPVPNAPLTIVQGQNTTSRMTLADGSFALPFERPSAATTIHVRHVGDSRLAGTEKTLHVDAGKAVTHLSLLVTPNRWNRGETAPMASMELRADGVPLAGGTVRLMMNSAHPQTVETDSRGRAEWALPMQRLAGAGTHRIQAVHKGNARHGPAHADAQISWVTTPDLMLEPVRLDPDGLHLLVEGSARVPDAAWFEVPIQILVDGDEVMEVLPDAEGRIHGKIPLAALPSHAFESTRVVALSAQSLREWIDPAASNERNILVPATPRAPLTWYLALVLLVASASFVWHRVRALLRRRREARCPPGGPVDAEHLRGRVLNRQGVGLPGGHVVLRAEDGREPRTQADSGGFFRIPHDGRTRGSLLITLGGHVTREHAFQSTAQRRALPHDIVLSTIQEAMLDQHHRLLHAYGHHRESRRWSPRKSLGHLLRATPHHHALHREVVALIEAAAFQRGGDSLDSLHRVEGLVSTLVESAPAREERR